MHEHDITESMVFRIDEFADIRCVSAKIKIRQNDHNSKLIRFVAPRIICGHDIMLCDKVEIHYENHSYITSQVNPDVYKVEDLSLEGEDEIAFSWLISKAATSLDGMTIFNVVFTCHGDDNVLTYELPVEKYTISIEKSINNRNAVLDANSDALEEIKKGTLRFDMEQDLTDEQTEQARENIDFENAMIEMLLKFNVLPVLVDSDGAILADSDGSILLNL